MRTFVGLGTHIVPPVRITKHIRLSTFNVKVHSMETFSTRVFKRIEKCFRHIWPSVLKSLSSSGVCLRHVCVLSCAGERSGRRMTPRPLFSITSRSLYPRVSLQRSLVPCPQPKFLLSHYDPGKVPDEIPWGAIFHEVDYQVWHVRGVRWLRATAR